MLLWDHRSMILLYLHNIHMFIIFTQYPHVHSNYIIIHHYGKKREIDNFKICSYLFFYVKLL